MSTRSLLSLWLVMLCIAGLLCVQLSGLHQHRHVDLHGDRDTHAVQLHFEDAGWHGDEASGEHRHGNGLADAAHPHLDVETKVVEDGVAKPFFVVLLGLLLSWGFLVWRRPDGGVPRPAPSPWLRRSRFDGPPPSHAPPRFLSHTA